MTRKGSIIIETSKSVDGIASIHRSLIGKKWWDSLQDSESVRDICESQIDFRLFLWISGVNSRSRDDEPKLCVHACEPVAKLWGDWEVRGKIRGELGRGQRHTAGFCVLGKLKPQ
jgi:hypothetical protein